MINHAAYVAVQDADELLDLIEVATKRIEDLKLGGWVYLLVVSDNANIAWFAKDDYQNAVEFLIKVANKHASEGNRYDLGLQEHRYRQGEARELLEDTKRVLSKYK